MRSLLELQRAFARELPAVYRGNVHGNRAKALASAYPVVRKIVGDEFFDALAARYAPGHPTRSGDLNEYGAELASFLERFAPAQDLPYLPDVARLDWLVHRAYFAADPSPFAMKKGPDPFSGVRLAPACALLASAWPLGRLWTIHQDDYQGEFAIDLGAGPDRVLVHRPRWRPEVLSLDAGDYAFLEAVQRGEPLGAALEAAVAAEPTYEVSATLVKWIDAGVIEALA